MDCKSEAKSDPVGCGQYELGSNDGRPWGLLVRFIVRGAWSRRYHPHLGSHQGQVGHRGRHE